jgi:hypothetical protein
MIIQQQAEDPVCKWYPIMVQAQNEIYNHRDRNHKSDSQKAALCVCVCVCVTFVVQMEKVQRLPHQEPTPIGQPVNISSEGVGTTVHEELILVGPVVCPSITI